MELKFTIDTDDLYDEESTNFETILTDSLRRAVVKDCKDRLATDKFKEFSDLTSEAIIAAIKLKMSNFLSEDIALTDKWGKAQFVGSIEDLIKSRFDDVLLRPVDRQGKTNQGCTTSGNTWIEWKIQDALEERFKYHFKTATTQLERYVEKLVEKKIIEIKDKAIKAEVDSAFSSMLKSCT